MRKELQWFMKCMERKLNIHDHKGETWKALTPEQLLTLLNGEVAELASQLRNSPGYTQGIIDECADVANYAMMIADVVR